MIDLALDGRVFIDTPIDEALQELDLIFNTTNGELIGYADFGTNFEQFLWQITPSPEALKRYIHEKILDSYFLSTFDIGIDVYVLDGEFRSIYHVVVSITDKSGNTKTKEYQFR